jgi:hypothetical protein
MRSCPAPAVSKVPGARESGNDEWGTLHASGISVTGRMLLNLWRLMRSELKLSSYSLASVTAAVLRQWVPHISQQQMSSWYAGGPAGEPGVLGPWLAAAVKTQRENACNSCDMVVHVPMVIVCWRHVGSSPPVGHCALCSPPLTPTVSSTFFSHLCNTLLCL